METGKILRDLYCYLCSLQFDGKLVYDMHQSFMHNYKIDVNSVQKFIKTEFNLPPKVPGTAQDLMPGGPVLLRRGVPGTTFWHQIFAAILD